MDGAGTEAGPKLHVKYNPVVEVGHGDIRSYIADVVDKIAQMSTDIDLGVRMLNGTTFGIADLVLSLVALLLLPEQHELEASESVTTPI